MYCGEDAVSRAERRYIDVASGKAPDEMAVVSADGGSATIIELLKKAGFAASNSEARRLIEGKAVKINGETIGDVYLAVDSDAVLSCGKNRFARVCFSKNG